MNQRHLKDSFNGGDRMSEPRKSLMARRKRERLLANLTALVVDETPVVPVCSNGSPDSETIRRFVERYQRMQTHRS